MTEQGLIANLSLATLEEYLSHTTKIGLLHNADDIILADGELDYLKGVLGPRAKIYPRGGHCGNLDHRDTLSNIVDFFRNPLPANMVQRPVMMRPSPTPIPVSYRTHQATGPEELPAPRFLGPISYRPSLDFQSQLDQPIQELEAKLEASHAYLQAAQTRATAPENHSDSARVISSRSTPDAEGGMIEPAKWSVKTLCIRTPDISWRSMIPSKGLTVGYINLTHNLMNTCFCRWWKGMKPSCPIFSRSVSPISSRTSPTSVICSTPCFSSREKPRIRNDRPFVKGDAKGFVRGQDRVTIEIMSSVTRSPFFNWITSAQP